VQRLCLAEEERERGWFRSGGGDCGGSGEVQPAQHIHLLPLLNQPEAKVQLHRADKFCGFFSFCVKILFTEKRTRGGIHKQCTIF
jgi:hypothetical protein